MYVPYTCLPRALCVHRFDFILQSDLADDLGSYAAMISAHKVYWGSKDLMFCLLTQSLKAILLPGGSELGRTGEICHNGYLMPMRRPSQATNCGPLGALFGCPAPTRGRKPASPPPLPTHNLLPMQDSDDDSSVISAFSAHIHEAEWSEIDQESDEESALLEP